MNKYIEAEKRLAELLGWIKDGLDIQRNGYINTPTWRHVSRKPHFVRGEVPVQWTRDNAAAFSLMVEHGCYPSEMGGECVDVGEDDQIIVSIRIADHPDMETTVRYTIVQAVIAKLEKQRAAGGSE